VRYLRAWYVRAATPNSERTIADLNTLGALDVGSPIPQGRLHARFSLSGAENVALLWLRCFDPN
jgi:hypothetical protein